MILFKLQKSFFSVKLLALIALLLLILPSTAQAQEDMPVWYQNKENGLLKCDYPQKYEGVEYCTGVIKYSDDGESKVHLIIVDLKSPSVNIEYIIAEGVDGYGVPGECKDVNRSAKHLPGCDDPIDKLYPVITINQAVEYATKRLETQNIAVVINGDYSACTVGPNPSQCPSNELGQPTYRVHGPQGLTVVRGSRLDGPMNGDNDNNLVRVPWLAISRNLSDNSPFRVKAEIHKFKSDNGHLPYPWIYTGIGGGPWLVQNGGIDDIVKVGILRCEELSKNSCRDNASQTAAGLTLNKRWLFLVLAVEPRTLLDLANFMDTELDVWQAMKFDGGGSSQLYYAGAETPYVELGNKERPEDTRPLTNYLAVVAQPGNGIDLSGEYGPATELDESTPQSTNWLDRFLAWWRDTQVYKSAQEFLNWINGTRENIDQTIKEWEEFLQNIQDPNWWAHKMAELILQLCGLAFVPTTVLFIRPKQRNRNKLKKNKRS